MRVEDILEWESVHGKIPEGSFVAFMSNWSKRKTQEAMENADEEGVKHYPGWSMEALEFLVKDLCDDFFDIAMIQNKTLKVSSNLKHKNILSDKNKLRQLFVIFLDNAFKYTEEEDYIKVSLNEKGEKIIVKIEDNGLGIKKEEIPHLFDRFFRSENVRNKDIDGSGIGLSIAKVICDSLKYKLEVDSEYGKWTEFKISIPIDVD